MNAIKVIWKNVRIKNEKKAKQIKGKNQKKKPKKGYLLNK